MERLFAFLLLLIPGLMATLGIKYIRDTMFNELQWPFPLLWVQAFSGFIMVILGIAFISGFIYHRDKKRQRVKKRRLSR